MEKPTEPKVIIYLSILAFVIQIPTCIINFMGDIWFMGVIQVCAFFFQGWMFRDAYRRAVKRMDEYIIKELLE